MSGFCLSALIGCGWRLNSCLQSCRFLKTNVLLKLRQILGQIRLIQRGGRFCPIAVVIMKLFILWSLSFLELVTSSSSDLDCFLDQQECEIHPDNLITTVTDVLTIHQCLALCQDQFTCVAFTHFGPEGFPLRASCVMFSSCATRRPCLGCTTGSSQSECLCSIHYSSGVDSGNFVDMVSAVDEHDCKRRCIFEEMCKVDN